jgi:RNA polymerase sigma factor for flagellar operon FliA
VISAVDRRLREGLPLLDGIVRAMGRRFAGLVTEAELRSHGHKALLEAAQSYDPERASLATYLARKIRWAILDGVKRESRGRAKAARVAAVIASEALLLAPAEPADESAVPEEVHEARLQRLLSGHAAAMALGLLGGGVQEACETPEERTSRAQLCEVVRRAVQMLPERERTLVERHYYEGESFEAIAQDLGISKSWASRLHAQAIRTLAKELSETDV